jgi:chondroitin 4-sulfotransferase 11
VKPALPRRLQRAVFHLRARYVDDFVFVHINKTAGSSIESALRLPFQHRTALEWRALLGKERWERRFSFAIVRNPWDKVASHYYYRVKTDQTALGTDPLDFNTWVKRAYGERDPRLYDKPKMFMPQADWISDEAGRRIVEFVGRFERLEEDFRTICRRIGVQAALPHEKASANRDYRRGYTPDAAEVVARRFARDIEEFGYAFD